jgi:hypothetical protein
MAMATTSVGQRSVRNSANMIATMPSASMPSPVCDRLRSTIHAPRLAGADVMTGPAPAGIITDWVRARKRCLLSAQPRIGHAQVACISRAVGRG